MAVVCLKQRSWLSSKLSQLLCDTYEAIEWECGLMVVER